MPKSPFPANYARAWLSYGGLWNSDTALMDQSGINIRHGASSEGGAADVSTMEFALTNSAGTYNPRNPNSPLYGLIGRNTKARATCALGAPWLSSFVTAADSATTSPTGDLDLKWWGALGSWESSGTLASKFSAVGQFSYVFESAGNGLLRMWWSADGSTTAFVQSVVPVPAWAGPVALRATLDVNNGIGGSTVTFWYAADLDSPWVPLGSPISITTTIQSVFDSNSSTFIGTGNAPGGKIFGWEFRSGINGSVFSSGHADRWLIGYNKNTLLRSNLFYDPYPGGPVETWAATNGIVGVIDDPTHGRVIESRKTTASGGAQAQTNMDNHALDLSPSTTYKMAFDVLFEGSGSASAVNLMWRPSGATSTTGQVTVASNLEANTEWNRVEVTFTTTATAPGAFAAFAVTIPSAYALDSRVLMRNVTLSASSATDLSAFSGDDENTTSRFYFWTAGKYVSSSVEYSAVATSTLLSDDQGRNWNHSSGAVTNRHTLMVGEVAEWPTEWNKKGAPSVMANLTASGVSRRLGQGEEPVQSPIYRAITGTNNPNLVDYWPMEDGSSSTRFGSAVGGLDAWWAGSPSLAADSGFGGSKPIPTLGNARVRGRVERTSLPDGIQVRWIMRVDPAAPSWHPLEIYLTGNNLNLVRLRYIAPTGNLALVAYNAGGDTGRIEVPTGSGEVAFNAAGKEVRMGVELEQSGADVAWKILMNEENGTAVQYSGFFSNVTLFSVTDVLVNASQVDTQGTAFGHLTIEKGISSIYDVPGSVLGGYEGELAATRLRRISAERDIPIVVAGTDDGTAALAPQGDHTWLEIARDAEAADGGILHDDPTDLGFRYRSLHSLGSQPPVVIDYQDNLILPFEPVDDDAMIRNRVTRSRPNGSPYTAVRDSGALSTKPVPDGVGVYDDAQELGLATDGMAVRMADWGLHIGTWDDTRYPTLGVDLAHPKFLNDPILTRQLLSMSLGGRLVIKGVPSWLPPFDVDVLVTGININITPEHVYLKWTCIPARPHRVGYWNADHRYSGEGTTLSAGITSTATAFTVTLPTGITWTHADGDYNIIVGGEIMTVTNVTGGNSMTVIRSVNGVSKSHLAGAPVALADPTFYAR